MFCANCGAQLSDDLNFCNMCGNPLKAADAPVFENQPAANAEDDAPTMIFTPSSDSDGIMQPEAQAPAAVPVQPAYQQPTPQYAPPVQPVQTPPRPMEVQTAPASYTTKPVKKKSVAKIIIFSILFGILILIFGVAAAVTGTARNILAENRLSNAVAEAELSEIVVGDIISDDAFADFLIDQLEANGGDMVDTDLIREGYEKFLDEFVDDDTTIGDLVVIAVDEDDFKTKDVEKLISSSGLTRAIADVVAAYEEHLLTGDDVNCISVSKIMKIIEKTHKEIEELADTSFDLETDLIEEVIEDNDDILDDIAPQETLKGVGKYSSLALSPVTIIILAVLAVLFAALIAITSRSIPASFVTFGICAILTGGTFIVATFLENTILKIVSLEYDVITTFAMELVDKAVFSVLFRNGLIIAGAGAACIVIGIIISAVTSAIAKKKARTA